MRLSNSLAKILSWDTSYTIDGGFKALASFSLLRVVMALSDRTQHYMYRSFGDCGWFLDVLKMPLTGSWLELPIAPW